MASEYAESLRGKGTGQGKGNTGKGNTGKGKGKGKTLAPTPAAPDYSFMYDNYFPTRGTYGYEPPPNVVPAYEVFKAAFANLFANVNNEDSWLKQMYTVAQGLYKTGFTTVDLPDQLLNDTSEATRLYRERFSGITELKRRQAAGENVSYIPSVAQYAEMSKQMKQDLTALGLNSVATDASIGKIIGADVDYTEFTKRIDTAFKAIDNADQWLKSELATNYGNLSREDLALGLLGGREGSDALKKKIEVAGVRAGAAEFGLRTQMDAGELSRMGVDRATARQGYQKTSKELSGISQAAGMFGQRDLNLQAELEQENVLGKESSKVKSLRSQARSQFQGSSGITQGSLGRKKQL